MNNEIFQKIFDMIRPILPEGWNKMVLYVGYTAGSYTMKYYSRDSKGAYTDCFNQKGVNKTQLIKLFMCIDNVLSAERKLIDNKWSVMTMIVGSDGSMKTDFEYDDISENAIAYEQSWKKRYIK